MPKLSLEVEMTFYNVDIYSPNIAGSASDQESLMAALDVVEKYFQTGDCKNAGWCAECQRNPYTEGSPLYHSFMIREKPAYEIVRQGRFTWTKKKGLGRQTQVEYLERLVNAGAENWFQLETSEI
jgi:hypothetical protein